ncbi:hypothetical protein FRB99_007593 [Tulasnella sp. 403]|nr:hypothetical protein FRB99_007593 [Tulasnella sp. 403]
MTKRRAVEDEEGVVAPPRPQTRQKRLTTAAKDDANTAVASSDGQDALPPATYEQVASNDFAKQFRIDLPGADVFYQPQFVDVETAEIWYSDLEALETWHRPTLKVYGKSVVQSRAIAAYATSPSLTLKYSGQVVDMHHPYPPLLQDIQTQVEQALGVSFNHVMLNRYDDGSVYIGKHSDNLENKVIASLSLGAERTFIMSPRKGFTADTRKWALANGSLFVMQGDTQRNWKHEIPREPKVQKGRISLTFRQLVYD